MERVHHNHWAWASLIAILSVSLWSITYSLLPISISNDSYGYFDLARSMGTETAPERSYGYPFLLAVLGIQESDSLFRIIFLQSLLTISIPLLVYFALEGESLKVRVLCAIGSCLYTYPYALSLSVLTESLYVFALTLYGFFVCRYYRNPTTLMALAVAISCILIALLRVSGAIYYMGFALSLLMYWSYQYFDSTGKKYSQKKLIGRHLLVSLVVFGCYATTNNLLTYRTSSVVVSHFAFNWSYRSTIDGAPYHGIIRPENGPSSTQLFKDVEEAIEANWLGAFDTLKNSGSERVKSLKPGDDNLYTKAQVEMLMDDIINNNNRGDFRSWEIIAAVATCCTPSKGWGYAYRLAGEAIKEGFIANPMTVVDRLYLVFTLDILGPLLGKQLIDTLGFKPYLGHSYQYFNNVTLPSAYFHQVPKGLRGRTPLSDTPFGAGIYKEWITDLYGHSGPEPKTKFVDYELMHPKTFADARHNYDIENITSVGHYFVQTTSQVIRLAWILIMCGSFMMFFVRKPKLCCLIFVGVVSPVLSVFLSELDPRHLYMAGPFHLIAAGVVLGIMARSRLRKKLHL